MEMADDDFRTLLKRVFPDLPSYHIDALAKIAKKKERKPSSFDRLTKMMGGVM